MQPRQLSQFLVIFAACGISACGGGLDLLEAPVGPNGGQNTLSVERDGVLEDLDSIQLRFSPEGDDQFLLSLSGAVNGPKNVADAGYSIVLELRLMKHELLALAQPSTVVVDGTSRFIPPMTTEYTRAAAASPAVEGAAARMFCFCELDQAGTQKVTGELTVNKATEAMLYGSVQVTIDGFLPGRGQNSVLDIRSEFDLEVLRTAGAGLIAR